MAMSVQAINDIFRYSANLAQECAKNTKDDGQKGIIYATLALAMANTGVVKVDLEEAADLAPKAEATREDLKPKAAVKEAEPAEEAPQEVAEEPTVEAKADEAPKADEEKVFGSEWTDEAVEYFAAETEFIQEHQGKLYEAFKGDAVEAGQSEEEADIIGQEQATEFFNSEIEKATAGVCHSAEDINPMNIRYIVEFLKAVERGEDPSEGQYLPY